MNTHWKSAQHEPAQWDGSTNDRASGTPQRCSAEQPVASSTANAADLSWSMPTRGRLGPVVQLIMCGAGARYAGLSDRREIIATYGTNTFQEGSVSLDGLEAYISVYTENAPYTNM